MKSTLFSLHLLEGESDEFCARTPTVESGDRFSSALIHPEGCLSETLSFSKLQYLYENDDDDGDDVMVVMMVVLMVMVRMMMVMM